jgi:glycosyltransferase involved in cell wall biosynthesis
MRIGYMLVGNPPFVPSGYGNQLRMIAKILQGTGRPVAHTSNFGFAARKMDWEGITLYPCDNLPGVLSSKNLTKHIKDFRISEGLDEVIVITLGDAFRWKGLINHPYWLALAPVDHSDVNQLVVDSLSGAKWIGCLTQWGRESLVEIGFDEDSLFYLPHTIDDEYFDSYDKEFCRLKLGFPNDAFIVGFMGDASSRKCPRENIGGYAHFSLDKQDTVLFVKGSRHPQAIDVKRIAGEMNMPSLVSTDEYDELLGLTTTEMAEALSCLDVLLHASSQEGFGIIQVEAQALGIPVIGTNWGAMRELNANSGLLAKVDRIETEDGGGKIGIPSSEDITALLQRIYTLNPNNEGQFLSDIAKSFALDYKISHVGTEYWLPLLNHMENQIMQDITPFVVPPVEGRVVKKVGLLTTYNTQCGIATYSEMLRESLEAKGVEVVVFAEAEDITKVSSELDDDGVSYCWHRATGFHIPFEEAVKKSNIDLLHIQHEWTIYSGTNLTQAVANLDCKRVITWHTPDPEGFRQFGMQHDRVVDAHITHWNLTTETLRSMPPIGAWSTARHIPHGIKAPSYEPYQTRKEVGVPSKVPLFFSFGFSNASKGTHILIEAIDILNQDDTCPYFEVILGLGSHPKLGGNDYTQKLVERIKNSDNVTILDRFLEEDEVDKLAAASDYFVFPYAYNGLIHSCSGAVRRIVGYGKPVITTTEGRLRDLLGGIHGWKVDQFDAKGLAAAMRSAINCGAGSDLWNDYSNAVFQLSEQCSWPNVAEQHLALYNHVAATESWIFPKLPSTDTFLQMHRDSYVVEKDVTEDY